MSTNVIIMGDIPKSGYVAITCGPGPALSDAIKEAVEKCFAPKESDEPESSTPVKYYRVTAYTPYCGEHLEDFIATSSEDELEAFKQNLIEDCAAEWEPCWVDYEEEGYESEDEWQEAYYGGCGATVEEITEAEYKEETKPRWPYELVKKEVD